MAKGSGQPNMETAKTPSLQDLELKANLNPEQREYLEVLKGKIKKILGNKTKQELAKAGDLATLKKYKAILTEILDFLQTKEIKKPPELKGSIFKIQAETNDGEVCFFDFEQELNKSKEFFKEMGVDWVDFPEKIALTESQASELRHCVEEFNFNRIMVIPEGLADNFNKRDDLQQAMTQNYRPTKIFVYWGDETFYPNDLLLETRNKIRLILYRDQQGLDELYLKTRNIPADDMLDEKGMLNTLGLDAMSEAEFLTLQQRYFLERGDYMYYGDDIALLGSKKFRLAIDSVDRILCFKWQGTGDSQSPKGIYLDSWRTNGGGGGVGSPLIKSFDIEYK